MKVSCAELVADDCFDLLEQGQRKAKRELLAPPAQLQQPLPASPQQQPWARHTSRAAPIPSLAGVPLPIGSPSPAKLALKSSSWRAGGGDDTTRVGDDCASVSAASSAWSLGSLQGAGATMSPGKKLQVG